MAKKSKEQDYYLTMERNPKDGLFTIVCFKVKDGEIEDRVVSRPASQKFIFSEMMLVAKAMMDKKTMPNVLKHLGFK